MTTLPGAFAWGFRTGLHDGPGFGSLITWPGRVDLDAAYRRGVRLGEKLHFLYAIGSLVK